MAHPKQSEYTMRWKAKNPERAREIQWRCKVKKKYGLSLEKYNEIMQGPCGICGEESEALDHCHVTGRVRGPLCTNCNHGLGKFRDDPERLAAAIRYLEVV